MNLVFLDTILDNLLWIRTSKMGFPGKKEIKKNRHLPVYMFVFDFTWFYNLQEKEFKKFKIDQYGLQFIKKTKKQCT